MDPSRLTALAKALGELHERCPCPADNGECSAANECALLPLAPALRDFAAAALVALEDAGCQFPRWEDISDYGPCNARKPGHELAKEYWCDRCIAIAQAETLADALLGKEETGG